MFQQNNTFLQQAVRNGQALLTEVNKTQLLSQEIISNCDKISMDLSAGNVQGAINSVQNIRNMANQVAQSSQFFNQAVNERLDIAEHALGRIQYRVNQMSNAIQSVRSSSNNQIRSGQYGNWMPHNHNQFCQYGMNTSASINNNILGN